MEWDCNCEIEQITKNVERNINNYIEMLYIQAVSELNPKIKYDTEKVIDYKLLENYFKRRGYTMNYILGKRILIKGFVAVYNGGNYVEVWHDVLNNYKSVFVNESLLTALPTTLDYMERI